MGILPTFFLDLLDIAGPKIFDVTTSRHLQISYLGTPKISPATPPPYLGYRGSAAFWSKKQLMSEIQDKPRRPPPYLGCPKIRDFEVATYIVIFLVMLFLYQIFTHTLGKKRVAYTLLTGALVE